MTSLRMNTLLKVSLVLVVILIGVGLFMADKKLHVLAEETLEQKTKLQVSQKQIEVYKKTQSKIEALRSVNEIAKKVLPETQDQSAIVAEVSEFAKRSGITLEAITFPEQTLPSSSAKAKSRVPKGVVIEPLTIDISQSTKYEDLIEFLTYLEQNRRKMQVTQIAITPNVDDRNLLNEVVLSLNLYSRAASVKTGASQ